MMRKFTTLAGLAAALVLPAAFAHAAGAKGATFTASPTAVHAGSTIIARSVTLCRAPAGVTAHPVIDLRVTRGATTLGESTTGVLPDGAWKAGVEIGAVTTSGPATLTATCRASAQAEGALVVYDPLTINVTSDLAVTGLRSVDVLTVLGGAAALAGVVLVAGSRRSRRL